MYKFFSVFALLLGISVPCVASAQAVDCSLPAFMYSESCRMHGRTAHGPIPYKLPMICTIIRIAQPVRKVTFVVRDAAGNVLNPPEVETQHTSDKKDHEVFCVGRHWWEKARDTGGTVEFCIEPEPERGLVENFHRKRWTFRTFEVTERLKYGERDYGAMAKYYAALKTPFPK